MGIGGLFLLWVRGRDKSFFSVFLVSLVFPGVWRFQAVPVLYFISVFLTGMNVRIIGYHYVVGLGFCSRPCQK